MTEPKARTKNPSSPWLVVLFLAPIPVILLLFFAFQWNKHQTDLSSAATILLKRQNRVLAHDAMTVSQKISELLESAIRDVKTLALLPEKHSTLQQFAQQIKLPVTRFDPNSLNVSTSEVPLYSELSISSLDGRERLAIRNGKVDSLKNVSDCQAATLCDRELWEGLLKSPVGTFRVGNLYRYYSTKDEPEDLRGATLRVGLRTATAVYLVGIDYIHLQNILYTPSFPYEPKTNLLAGYDAGNYIYFVNAEYDFLAHPKYWHVVGIDKATGKPRRPAKTDSDLGRFPLNIKAYEGHELKDYFTRLITVSFSNNNVDLFRAPNLTGKIRVLSVTPIFLRKAQFTQTGIFGYVITGCRVEYFEEPNEKYLPYF